MKVECKPSKVVTFERLNFNETNRILYHMEVSLEGTDIRYEPGDSIGIYPVNDPVQVAMIIEVLDVDPQTEITVKQSEEKLSFEKFLLSRVNLSRCTRELVTLVQQNVKDPINKEKLTHILDPEYGLLYEEIYDSYHVWDFLVEFLDKDLPIQEFCDTFLELLPRYYSCASTMNVVGDQVDLLVGLDVYISGKYQRKGICSYYLAELLKAYEDEIDIFHLPAPHFKLPEDTSTPIIMIGPGTGLAPFRGFLQERQYQEESSKNWLIFGDRHEEHNFYYKDYILNLVENEILKFDAAWSRDQDHKVYVQDIMRNYSEEVWKWLEEGAHLYVCGDAERMAKHVKKALLEIIQTHGKMSSKDAKNHLKAMRLSKRFQQDVY